MLLTNRVQDRTGESNGLKVRLYPRGGFRLACGRMKPLTDGISIALYRHTPGPTGSSDAEWEWCPVLLQQRVEVDEKNPLEYRIFFSLPSTMRGACQIAPQDYKLDVLLHGYHLGRSPLFAKLKVSETATS